MLTDPATLVNSASPKNAGSFIGIIPTPHEGRVPSPRQPASAADRLSIGNDGHERIPSGSSREHRPFARQMCRDPVQAPNPLKYGATALT
jgi:hypothetical protein